MWYSAAYEGLLVTVQTKQGRQHTLEHLRKTKTKETTDFCFQPKCQQTVIVYTKLNRASDATMWYTISCNKKISDLTPFLLDHIVSVL